jgi:hypothetical protein
MSWDKVEKDGRVSSASSETLHSGDIADCGIAYVISMTVKKVDGNLP